MVAAAGFVSAAAYSLLAWASLAPGKVPLAVFFLCLGLAAAACVLVFLTYRKTTLTSSLKYQLLAWAIVFRAIGFLGAPLYEDDFYRYLWDGRTFAISGSPYGQPPSASFGAEVPAEFEEILSRVNYPDIPTIYGPACESAFLLAHWIAPGKLWGLKFVFLLSDGAILWLLWKMTGPDARWVLYAWSPLVIKEVAFTVHSDVLAAALLLASIWAFRKEWGKRGAALLALAVAAKVTALLFVPLLLWRRRWSAATTFCSVLALCYLPFLLRGATEFQGLKAFAATWEYNSFVFGLLRSMMGWDAARSLCGLLLAGFYVYYWLRWNDLSRASLLVGVFFLLAPVVNPWYLLLLVPFVALQPSAWGIMATISVLVAYVTGATLGLSGLGQFDHPWWVRPVEILPVLLAGAWDRAKGLFPQYRS